MIRLTSTCINNTGMSTLYAHYVQYLYGFDAANAFTDVHNAYVNKM